MDLAVYTSQLKVSVQFISNTVLHTHMTFARFLSEQFKAGIYQYAKLRCI